MGSSRCRVHAPAAGLLHRALLAALLLGVALVAAASDGGVPSNSYDIRAWSV
jgi:hypothetical protein